MLTGEDLDDELKWVKFSCLSWTHDNRGFFYNRYQEPKVFKIIGIYKEREGRGERERRR